MTTESITPPPAPATEPDPIDEEPKSRRGLLILIAVVVALLVILASVFLWYLRTGKPVTQLPVLGLPTPPAYSTSIYDIDQPLSVAIDEGNDRLYTTQVGTDPSVLVFNSAGQGQGKLVAPNDKTKRHVPVYVAVDPATSDVYVSDRAASAVYVYDASGNYLRELKPVGVKSWSPLGLAFDKDGNVYVTDLTEPHQSVLKMKTDGTVITRMGEKDGLSFPNGVAVRDDGTIFVTDSNNGRVMAYKSDGTSAGALPRGKGETALGLPRGEAFDDRGRLYVVDTVNNSVNVYKPSDNGLAEFSFSFGEEGQNDGQFEFPNGIATDSVGRVYVADRQNNRVQVWSYR
ncbi:MAG: SMP-30/gluconolactonase/LRE family protein [Actinomycetes bacterium]